MKYGIARARAQVVGHNMGNIAVGAFQQAVQRGCIPIGFIPIVERGETVEILLIFAEPDTQPAPPVIPGAGKDIG